MSRSRRLLGVCALLGLAAQAQAQTYTAKLLNQPSGVSFCVYKEARLSNNGDVTANCFMPRVTLAGIAAALAGGNGAQSTPRAYAWRNGGSAQVLSGSLTKPRSYGHGILADGTVLGYIGTSNGSDEIGDLSAWKGSTRSAVALPAGYAAPWRVDTVSPGGATRLLWRNSGPSGMDFATWINGQARTLPGMPAACGVLGTTYNIHRWAVNDAGQVAVLRQVQDNPFVSTSNRVVGTICLWDGGRWQVSPPSINYEDPELFDSDFYEMELQGVSPAGRVMVRQGFAAYDWAPGQQAQRLGNLVRAYGANDELLGGDHPSGSQLKAPATIWRNGQALDLSQAATAPSGYYLATALSTNLKGQVLVVAQSTSNVGNTGNRLVLLTPR